MKLLIQHGQIVGTATDDYTGPEAFATAPDGFDLSCARDYQVVDGAVLPRPPGIADYIGAMESHYDAKASERRYDSRHTCALRAGYAGPFQAEGLAFALWMDQCNAQGYQMLEAFQAGEIEQPTVAELLAAMPELVWPER